MSDEMFVATWKDDKVAKGLLPATSGVVRAGRKAQLRSLVAPYKAGISTGKSAAGPKVDALKAGRAQKGQRRNAAINAHSGSIPRNSSTFKLSDRLNRG